MITPFPREDVARAVFVSAHSDDQTRAIAWLWLFRAGPSAFERKTPPASEDADGVFHAFTSRKVAALESLTSWRGRRSGGLKVFAQWLIDYRRAGAGDARFRFNARTSGVAI